MNKYQEEFFKFIRIRVTPPAKDAVAEIELTDLNELFLKQGEDIYLYKFSAKITTFFVSKIMCKKNGKEFELPFSLTNEEIKNQKQRLYEFELDFEDKIEEITFYFEKEYADPCTFKINYIEGNKERYFAKKEAAKRDEMLKNVNAKIRTGVDLVSVFFQPCGDDYGKTVVELYFATSIRDRENNIYKAEMKIADFNVEPGQFYKSITGLAKGSYGITLKQFSTSGKLLIETPDMFFYI